MASGIRKSGVRLFNFPAGRPYTMGADSSLYAEFGNFSFTAGVTSNTLYVAFNVFEFEAEITNNSIEATLGEFVPTFDVLAGDTSSLAVRFGEFQFSGVLEKSWELSADFYGYSFSAKMAETSPLSLGVSFVPFTFSGSVVGYSIPAEPVLEEDDANYQVWVLDRDSRLHSTYTKFPVDSIVEFGGRLLAAMSDGIYELTGDTDAGAEIDATLKWVPTAFGEQLRLRPDSFYFDFTKHGNIKFTTICDFTEERSYYLEGRSPSTKRRRIRAVKGLTGRIWEFVVENVDGEDFALEEFESVVVPLSRHI